MMPNPISARHGTAAEARYSAARRDHWGLRAFPTGGRDAEALFSWLLGQLIKDTEAARCVRPRGVLVLIEPWVTSWSRFVYSHYAHEPFEPEAVEWELSPTGPLAGANSALPWILWCRDRQRFEREFPIWEIRLVQPIMPVRYLLSGGIALRVSMPGWSFPFWARCESWLSRWNQNSAMFAKIVLQRRSSDPRPAADHRRNEARGLYANGSKPS